MLFARRLLLAAVAAFLPALTAAQAPPLLVELVERAAVNVPALHSTAAAQHNGLWVFVTGRTDGIHAIAPSPDVFPAAFANGLVVVYDPATDTRWTAPLTDLAPDVQASLKVTNAQHLQVGTRLVVIGGYGRTAGGDFVTFPTLTVLDLPGVVAAVQAGTSLAPHVRQTTASWLAVTGGLLLPEGDAYVLIGGQRFDGGYLTATQQQTYTDALRRFTLADDGTTLTATLVSETIDAARFHRRDGNAAPIVLPGGGEGIGIYGGVFTPSTLPYRTPIEVTPGAVDEKSLEARFGHYTCPTVPLFDARTDAMHTLFFGGMGQFTADNATGAVAEDRAVPFIDDVSVLSRASDGTVTETLLDVRLPGLFGTNAQWMAADGVPTWPNGVVRLDALTGRTRLGTIHGGITTDTPHPAFGGQPSTASARLFDVYVTAMAVSSEPDPSAARLSLSAPLPQPAAASASLVLTLPAPAEARVEVVDALGRRVAVVHDGPLAAGSNRLSVGTAALAPGLYVVRATSGGAAAVQRLVVAR